MRSKAISSHPHGDWRHHVKCSLAANEQPPGERSSPINGSGCSPMRCLIVRTQSLLFASLHFAHECALLSLLRPMLLISGRLNRSMRHSRDEKCHANHISHSNDCSNDSIRSFRSYYMTFAGCNAMQTILYHTHTSAQPHSRTGQVFIMLVRAIRRIATEAAAKCDSSLVDVVGSWFVVVVITS